MQFSLQVIMVDSYNLSNPCSNRAQASDEEIVKQHADF
jgi:hypothetical protein